MADQRIPCRPGRRPSFQRARRATGVGWPNSVTGATYVFALDNGVWSEVQKLAASDGASNDYFGNGVGVSNDGYVLVGAPYSVNSGGQGTLYVYKQQ